jgi:large conductance mechanosensitive channel
MNREFLTFLKEYGVVGLAIAVIIGGKLNGLVSALVEHFVMPLIGMALPDGDWRVWSVGPFGLGAILGALVDFLVVAWLVFWFAKRVLREETVGKK